MSQNEEGFIDYLGLRSVPDSEFDDLHHNGEHLSIIFHKLKRLKNLLNLLADSIFDDIGRQHQTVKQAIVLSLFSGIEKIDQDCPLIQIRGHIHSLLIGSRCSVKNVFLKHLKSLMEDPPCRYIIGSNCSIRLMATSLNRKGQSSGNKMLVSSDRCIVCIEELEKLNFLQQQIIIQSMEHQTIGVKGKLNTILYYPSNMTFITAANSKSNSYDRRKSIEKNVKLSRDLLTKFDLIFLIDDDDPRNLSCLSTSETTTSHELYETHIKQINNSINSSITGSSENNDELILTQLIEYQNTNTMAQMIFDENNKLILSGIVVPYIKYCFEHFKPAVNDSHKQTLSKMINSGEISSTIVTSRQRIYETVIRLSEAHARMHMRMEVNDDDLAKAIDIVRKSLTFSRRYEPVMESTSASRGGFKPATLFKLLCEARQNWQRKHFTLDEIIELCSKCLHIKLDCTQISNAVYALNEQALILKRSHNLYELI